MEKHRRNRYAHWAYIYAGALFAFQAEGCVRGSALPAFVQLALVLGVFGGTPFLIKRLFNFAVPKLKQL